MLWVGVVWLEIDDKGSSVSLIGREFTPVA
jgi:hypothetical protein